MKQILQNFQKKYSQLLENYFRHSFAYMVVSVSQVYHNHGKLQFRLYIYYIIKLHTNLQVFVYNSFLAQHIC